MVRAASFEWASAVMAMYAPEDFEAFDAIFNPPKPQPASCGPKWEAAVRDLNAQQRQWLIEDEAERRATEAKRTPEAVCRGFVGEPLVGGHVNAQQLPRVEIELPGDGMRATQAWLHHTLARVPGFEEVHLALEVKDGHCRSLWRAAVGNMLAYPAGRIDYPCRYVLVTLSHLAAGGGRDLRGLPGYFASDTWPRALILFAGVKVPSRPG